MKTTWKNQAGLLPVARGESRSAEELPRLRIRILGARSLRGSVDVSAVRWDEGVEIR